MKTLFSAMLILLVNNCFAQNGNFTNMTVQSLNLIDQRPLSTVSTEDLFKGKQTLYYYNEVYVVKGVKVFGTPFLYHDWSAGTIIGADGKIFTGYQLKYNAFDQAVLFQQGKDSLEVTDEIKEFTLEIKIHDTVENFHFVNANQYKKEKSKFYYEVLSEEDAGQLLRYDRKFVSDVDKSMPTLEGQKVFDIEFSYYYYDKNSKKITRIKADGTNIESILGKEAIAQSGLLLNDFNLSTEQDLRKFFDEFFASRKKKGF
ncbi:MAG: hypothetical protein ACHQEB_04555 [Chitinophagales bacterium]